jgi:hypothetical protein
MCRSQLKRSASGSLHSTASDAFAAATSASASRCHAPSSAAPGTIDRAPHTAANHVRLNARHDAVRQASHFTFFSSHEIVIMQSVSSRQPRLFAQARVAPPPASFPGADIPLKVRKQWLKLYDATPFSTVRNDIPGAEANATGIGCVTAFPIVVENGPPRNREVRRLHANAIEMETGRTYAAGQSPMPPASEIRTKPPADRDFYKCKNFLQQGIETRRGVVQFVSVTRHSTPSASKEQPILDQLQAKFDNDPDGVDMVLGERYQIRDLVAVDGAAAGQSDHRHVVLTVHDRETNETFTVPVTQIALEFNGGKMLAQDDILRANAIVDAHLALAPGSVRSPQQTDPLMVSQGGIGRNAALITYREICRQFADGAINNEDALDRALNTTILRGRERRGPGFIHTIEQFHALRTTLLVDLESHLRISARRPPASPTGSANRQRIEKSFDVAGSGETKTNPPGSLSTPPAPRPTSAPAAPTVPPPAPAPSVESERKWPRREAMGGSSSPKSSPDSRSPRQRRFSFFGDTRKATANPPADAKTPRSPRARSVSGDEGSRTEKKGKKSKSAFLKLFEKHEKRPQSPQFAEPTSPGTQVVIDQALGLTAATRNVERLPFDRLAFKLKDYGGGGDCLWHSLLGSHLSAQEVVRIRSEIATVRRASTQENRNYNFHQVASALYSRQGSGFELSTSERENSSLSNARYAEFQTLAGSYCGDDEIAQWLQVPRNPVHGVVVIDGDVGAENIKIFFRKKDGSIATRRFQPRKDAAENRRQIEKALGFRTANVVRLYRSKTHFQRIVRQRTPDQHAAAMRKDAADIDVMRALSGNPEEVADFLRS